MKHSKILADYKSAAAHLTKLQAMPAQLEARRDELVAAADLDQPAPAELASLNDKLLLLPAKIRQAEEALVKAEAALRAANDDESSRLGRVADEQERAIERRVLEALQPLQLRANPDQLAVLVRNIVALCPESKAVYDLRFVSGNSWSGDALTLAEKIAALDK